MTEFYQRVDVIDQQMMVKTHENEERRPNQYGENRFSGLLSLDEDRDRTGYALIKFIHVWQQPTLRMVIYDKPDISGAIGKTTDDATYHPREEELGQAQVWWGGKTGILWEVVPHQRTIQFCGLKFRPTLDKMWEFTEEFLREKGAAVMRTYDYDPAYDSERFGTDGDDIWLQHYLESRHWTLLSRTEREARHLDVFERGVMELVTI